MFLVFFSFLKKKIFKFNIFKEFMSILGFNYVMIKVAFLV